MILWYWQRLGVKLVGSMANPILHRWRQPAAKFTLMVFCHHRYARRGKGLACVFIGKIDGATNYYVLGLAAIFCCHGEDAMVIGCYVSDLMVAISQLTQTYMGRTNSGRYRFKVQRHKLGEFGLPQRCYKDIEI